MKKIIFLDGDGTLWYPKSTKYSKHPVWIWREHRNNLKKVKEKLVAIPTVRETLRKLKKRGIKLIVLSTNPYTQKLANERIWNILKHLKLDKFIDEVYGTKEHVESKGEYILKILRKYKISKKYALMVGDTYEWDYNSAKKVGVDAVLIKHNYPKFHPYTKRIKKKITRMSDLLKLLKI